MDFLTIGGISFIALSWLSVVFMMLSIVRYRYAKTKAELINVFTVNEDDACILYSSFLIEIRAQVAVLAK